MKKELLSYWSTAGTRERGQVVLSRGQGKEKVWQGLSGVAMTETEGFSDERLEDEELA